jgi:XTP/dITP diphosphohydrolase
MKTLYFITGNKGKALEAKNNFSELNIDIIQKDLGYPEIQADSLEEVARFGVDYVQKNFNQPFVLEDAGLFIDALDGFPGVYSAYIFYKLGCPGILELLADMDDEKRKATFRSVYAYSEPGKKPEFFVGECRGTISKEERGENGFGYDPIFIPEGETKTFGQMKTEEKNYFSHRGKSLEKLKNFLKTLE